MLFAATTFKRLWSPAIGEVLEHTPEETNEHDRFAVSGRLTGRLRFLFSGDLGVSADRLGFS